MNFTPLLEVSEDCVFKFIHLINSKDLSSFILSLVYNFIYLWLISRENASGPFGPLVSNICIYIEKPPFINYNRPRLPEDEVKHCIDIHIWHFYLWFLSWKTNTLVIILNGGKTRTTITWIFLIYSKIGSFCTFFIAYQWVGIQT